VVYNANLPRGTDPSWQTATNGANPLVPIDVQRSIIKTATEMSIIGRLAAQSKMSTKLKQMPVESLLPTAYFVSGDTGLIQTTTMGWKNVQMTAEEIAVIIPIPINLINDIDYDLWAQIKPKVSEAIAVALDAAVLFGTNKPASWPSALAVAAIAAGNTVTQGTGIDIAADLNNMLGAAESDGFTPNGIAHRQDLRASLRGLRSTTNEFVFLPNEPGAKNSSYAGGSGPAGQEGRESTIFGVRSISVLNGTFESHDTATANATKAIGGDWSQVILGTREDMDLEFSTSAIIQDANGVIQFNAFQQRLILGRFICRYGMACPNPINRTNQTDATRYPFSVLRDAA
jgi:HK97 family phage major capsid protein